MNSERIERKLAAIVAADVAELFAAHGGRRGRHPRAAQAHRKALIDPKSSSIAAASLRPPATAC